MKLLLITAKDETRDKIKEHFFHLGYDIIIYDNPLKALDNISEITPDAVLFNAEDFPRHWKPFLQVLRQISDRDSSVFILLTGESFSEDEAMKAGSLSVNAVISEEFSDAQEIDKLENILFRYIEPSDSRGPRRFSSRLYDNVEFLFNHPSSFKLITGSVSDMSFDGLRFRPATPQLTSDIKEGANIPSCSLRFGDYICSVDVRVIRNNKSISFRFVDFDEADRDCFIDFLDSLLYKHDLVDSI